MSARLSPKKILDFYDRTVYEYELTEVVRQDQKSGILYNATFIRNLITGGYYSSEYFHLEYKQFDDIRRIGGGDLIEEIASCYDRFTACLKRLSSPDRINVPINLTKVFEAPFYTKKLQSRLEIC